MTSDGGRHYSGYPRQHILVYRNIFAEINGIDGSGILEIGYKSDGKVLLSFLIYSMYLTIKI